MRPYFVRASAKIRTFRLNRYYYAANLNLEQSFAQIADELRQQYSLGYYPKNQALKKEKRRIKVSVSIPKSKVKTRENYIYKLGSQ